MLNNKNITRNLLSLKSISPKWPQHQNLRIENCLKILQKKPLTIQKEGQREIWGENSTRLTLRDYLSLASDILSRLPNNPNILSLIHNRRSYFPPNFIDQKYNFFYQREFLNHLLPRLTSFSENCFTSVSIHVWAFGGNWSFVLTVQDEFATSCKFTCSGVPF